MRNTWGNRLVLSPVLDPEGELEMARNQLALGLMVDSQSLVGLCDRFLQDRDDNHYEGEVVRKYAEEEARGVCEDLAREFLGVLDKVAERPSARRLVLALRKKIQEYLDRVRNAERGIPPFKE